MVRATNSCTPRWLQGGRRESSLLTFAALLVTQKREKRKVSSCFFAGEHCSPLQDKVRVQPIEKAKNMYSVPSAQILESRPPTLSAGVQAMRARICSAFSCTLFARVGSMQSRRTAKPPTFALPLCRTHSPRTARATNSCTREEFSKRGESSL